MAKRFFYGISLILHPVFLTTVGIMLLSVCLLPAAPLKSKMVLVLFSAGYSIVIPMCFITLAWLTGFVNSFQLRQRNERLMALIINVICLFFFQNMLTAWHAPRLMHSFTVGTMALMIVSAIICIFSHISLHAIAWGGLTALVSYLSFYLPNLSILLSVAIVLSGLAGTARLYLDEHTPIHIYSGFAIGFATIWLTLLILSL